MYNIQPLFVSCPTLIGCNSEMRLQKYSAMLSLHQQEYSVTSPEQSILMRTKQFPVILVMFGSPWTAALQAHLCPPLIVPVSPPSFLEGGDKYMIPGRRGSDCGGRHHE